MWINSTIKQKALKIHIFFLFFLEQRIYSIFLFLISRKDKYTPKPYSTSQPTYTFDLLFFIFLSGDNKIKENKLPIKREPEEPILFAAKRTSPLHVIFRKVESFLVLLGQWFCKKLEYMSTTCQQIKCIATVWNLSEAC